MKLSLLSAALIFSSCSSGLLKYNGDKNLAKNSDFEQKVKIISTEPTADPTAEGKVQVVKSPDGKTQVPLAVVSSQKKITTQKKQTKDKKSDKKINIEPIPVHSASAGREPDVEDAAGFEGSSRAPKVNPFRVGEVVSHSVRYYSAEAGVLSFSVKPFVVVNNRKSYNFVTNIKTSSLFSKFYSVDDEVETYIDHENLVPHVFKLHIKESAQVREAQSFFDQKTLKATYWEHKFTEKNGNEEKKQEWEILPFSQNAFSGIFYMRVFAWEIGKEYSFRVSDDEKNVLFKASAIQKELLSTDAGDFKAIKIKAHVVSRGALKTAEDIYFWLSDDEHKYVLRIEAKIKIGTLVSEVISVKPGLKE